MSCLAHAWFGSVFRCVGGGPPCRGRYTSLGSRAGARRSHLRPDASHPTRGHTRSVLRQTQASSASNHVGSRIHRAPQRRAALVPHLMNGCDVVAGDAQVAHLGTSATAVADLDARRPLHDCLPAHPRRSLVFRAINCEVRTTGFWSQSKSHACGGFAMTPALQSCLPSRAYCRCRIPAISAHVPERVRRQPPGSSPPARQI